jgi:EmrB/QacA subfamily drug resistance transporter
VLAAVSASYGLMQTLVIPVLPAIQSGLHTTQSTVTWVLTAYLLSASVATPVMGRLGDLWGKDRMLLAAVAALTAGSVLCGLADHVAPMLAGRALQGVGGGVLPLAFGIVRDEFPKQRVASVVGAISGITAGGSGIGIVLGGPIVEALDFHWLFYVPAMVLALGAVATRVVVPRSSGGGGGRVSWGAAALLSGWLLALLLAVNEAPLWGWGSGRVIGLLAGAAVLAAAWVAVEQRAEHPLVDMRLMRRRTVWSTNLVALLLGATLYAPFAFLPEYMQTSPSAGYGFGVSVTVSGLIMAPSGALALTLGLLAGRLAGRYGQRMVLAVGLSCAVLSFALLAVALSHPWEAAVAMALAGVGNGLSFASLAALVVEGVPPTHTGIAAGMNANIRTIGGAIGTAVMTSIVTAGVSPGALPPKSGYLDGFAAATAWCLGSVVTCLAIPRPTEPAALDVSALHAELGLVAGGTLAGDEPE